MLFKFTYRLPDDICPKTLNRAFLEAGGESIGKYSYRTAENEWSLTVDINDVGVVRTVLQEHKVPYMECLVSSRWEPI